MLKNLLPEKAFVELGIATDWHYIFSLFYLKQYIMPNSQNRNSGGNDNAGQGQSKDRATKASAPKPNPERSDLKHGEHDKDHQGDTSRSSNQGRKAASGGSAND